MSTLYLQSRLTLPMRRAGFVVRPRLEKLLDRLLEPGRRLGLVSAPPGYGKTQICAEWVRSLEAQRQISAAWLGLDENDSDPVRFWQEVGSAISPICPGIKGYLGGGLDSASSEGLSWLMASILEEIGEHPGMLVLILDDFHLARGIDETLHSFVENSPPNLRLLLATRADPGLGLAKLRARDELVELRPPDLQFTREEVEIFLAFRGVRLTSEQLDLLAARTEGWAAGLQLTGLSLQNRQDIDLFLHQFGGSHAFILDYLTEEVLDHLPGERRLFLLQTSILDQFTATACQALTERSDSQQELETLCTSNMFVVALDERRQWYRYHHLFADLLRAQLLRQLPGDIPRLQARAAEWCLSEGLFDAALGHFLEAGEVDRAAQLVGEHGLDELFQGRLSTLGGWLEKLPRETRNASAWLSLLEAWQFTLSGKVDRAATLLVGLESNHLSPREEGHAAALHAYLSSMRMQIDEVARNARQALACLPQSDAGMRALVTYLLGITELLRDEPHLALASLDQAARLADLGGNDQLGVQSFCTAGAMWLEVGDIARAELAYHEAERIAQKRAGSRSPLLSRVFSGLSNLAYEQNDLVQAEELARLGIHLAGGWGSADVQAGVSAALVRALNGQGNWQAAAAELERLEEIVKRSSNPQMSLLAAVRRLENMLAAPSLKRAALERWLEQTTVPLPGLPFYFRAFLTLARARAACALGKWTEAEELLFNLEIGLEAHGYRGMLQKLWIWRAVISAGQGAQAGVAFSLARALAAGNESPATRAFIEAGTVLRDWLKRLLPTFEIELKQRGQQILDAYPETHSPGLNKGDHWMDLLTVREAEVLRLIAMGKSNSEIASELVIALATVKRHINTIFAKLGVETRAQAMVKAREDGWV